MEGRGGHAAMPHLNIDPVPAAAALIQALQTLVSRETSPLGSAVLSITQLQVDMDLELYTQRLSCRRLIGALIGSGISRATCLWYCSCVIMSWLALGWLLASDTCATAPCFGLCSNYCCIPTSTRSISTQYSLLPDAAAALLYLNPRAVMPTTSFQTELYCGAPSEPSLMNT